MNFRNKSGKLSFTFASIEMTKNVFVVNNNKFGAENIFSKSEEIVVVLYNMRDHAQLIDGKTKFQTNFVKLGVGQLSRCPCIVHTSFPDLFSIYLDRTIKINLYVEQNRQNLLTNPICRKRF